MKKLLLYVVIGMSTYVGAMPSKLYFHQSVHCDQVVFYCAQRFSVTHQRKAVAKDGRMLRKDIFTIRGCLVNDVETLQAYARINHRGTRCKLTQLADDSMKLVFVYDPTVVKVSMHRFESIQHSYGLAFMVEKKFQSIAASSSTKRVIALDCGHGGKDNGAEGINGIFEKDLTLAIGKRLEKLLRQQGYTVFMTRTNDSFVPLDIRTTSANNVLADLFLSLHINSAPRSHVSGIETFCNDGSLYAPQVTMFEHKDQQSEKFAQAIQQSVINTVRQQYNLNDRLCKKKVSQVLMGTQMPSALIELGFCSNQDEASKLNAAAYQDLLVQGLAKGIHQYLKRV